MARTRNLKLPPAPTRTCPHCGKIHTAAEILRLDGDRLKCAMCGEAFTAIVDNK
jgi:transposase